MFGRRDFFKGLLGAAAAAPACTALVKYEAPKEVAKVSEPIPPPRPQAGPWMAYSTCVMVSAAYPPFITYTVPNGIYNFDGRNATLRNDLF